MRRHFVTYFSPGSFVAETSTMPIDSWDVDKAVEMVSGIKERYGATPYGFHFITRERGNKDLDSKVTKTSPMYYLGGEVFTIVDIEARNDPNDRILLSNMKGNRWNKIIVNKNSWKWTQPLKDGDVVLDFQLPSKASD